LSTLYAAKQERKNKEWNIYKNLVPHSEQKQQQATAAAEPIEGSHE
jgi:hypothetical protein